MGLLSKMTLEGPQAVVPAPVESLAGSSTSKIDPCCLCNGTAFWESVYADGVLRCLACEPPPSAALVGRRVGEDPARTARATRTASRGGHPPLAAGDASDGTSPGDGPVDREKAPQTLPPWLPDLIAPWADETLLWYDLRVVNGWEVLSLKPELRAFTDRLMRAGKLR